MAPTWLLALLVSPADAGVFTAKTSRGDWPATQVARDFVLPKGYLQVGLHLDSKASRAFRDGDGDLVDYDQGTVWRYSRLTLHIDQGFSRQLTLYARIPHVHAALRNDRDTAVSTFALGDVHTGVIWQPSSGEKHAGALRFDLKAPSGVEWPTDFIGGPGNTEGFLTGTGITNFGVHVLTRVSLHDRAALRLSYGYTHKFSGVVGYVVEADGFGNGWLSPGDEHRLGLDLQGQLTEDLAVSIDGRLSRRGTYRLGVSGPSARAADLTDIPDSAGAFVDTGVAASYVLSPTWELGAEGSLQLMGSDTRTFAHLGLEEFSPQPGLTMGLHAAARW